MVQIKKDTNQIAVSDIVLMYGSDRNDIKTMRRAVKVEALPDYKRWLIFSKVILPLGI